MDFFNIEIIGYASGTKKYANLVYQAFLNCKYPLDKISKFHTDREINLKIKLSKNCLEPLK